MAFSALAAVSSQGALILTGLIDGPLPGGTPKAVELYVTADIPDLSIYVLELVSNAGSPVGVSAGFAFSGSATAGSFLYIASESTEFTNVFGFAPTFTNGEANHNGDDDFYLYENSVVIDIWGGSPGIDNSGTESDILDSWAYRNNGTGPTTTFDASEWTIAAINSLDGLDAAATAAAVPFGTYDPIPEPSAALLGGLGLLALLRRRR